MMLYDILMLVVLVGTIVFGAWKGMAWQLASLASLALSYVLALRFGPQLASLFDLEPPLNRFVGMLVVYLATSLVVWMLFRTVAQAIDRVKLKEFDRQVGALFGAAKGVLLCLAITFFAVTLSQRSREAVLQSQSGIYMAKLIDRADAVLPEEIHDVLGPYLHRLEHGLDEDAPPDASPEDYHGHVGQPAEIKP